MLALRNLSYLLLVFKKYSRTLFLYYGKSKQKNNEKMIEYESINFSNVKMRLNCSVFSILKEIVG